MNRQRILKDSLLNTLVQASAGEGTDAGKDNVQVTCWRISARNFLASAGFSIRAGRLLVSKTGPCCWWALPVEKIFSSVRW